MTRLLPIVIYGLLCYTLGLMTAVYFPSTVAGTANVVGVSASVVREPLEITQHKEQMVITWISDEKAVDETLADFIENNPDKPNTVGLSWQLGNECYVWVKEPVYDYDANMQILGHEIMHCFRGKLHD